jgi:hypothetical protein
MYYQINQEGFYLGIKSESNENMEYYTEVPIVGNFIKFRCVNDIWVEGATLEEIAEYQQTLVPQIITRRQFKIALAVLGKNENDILNGINQLPEPTKTIALISYTEAGTFERSNAELIFVGKTFLQMTDAQIDNIFIVGSQY